jgi:hypothetical protein
MAHPDKRRRCVECVSKGHTFEMVGVGHCITRRHRRHHREPRVRVRVRGTPYIFFGASGCGGIGHPDKRVRCVECVSKGHAFDRRGVGRCYPHRHPRHIRVRSGCGWIAWPGKRRRCYDCVASGRRFDYYGAGHCIGAAPPPPPPPPVHRPPPPPPRHRWTWWYTRHASGCNHIPPSDKRTRCLECVARANTFDTRGIGTCIPYRTGYWYHVRSGCTSIGHMDKRRRCYECVGRGFLFDRRGVGHCYPWR